MVKFSKYVSMLIFLVGVITIGYNQIYNQKLSPYLSGSWRVVAIGYNYVWYQNLSKS